MALSIRSRTWHVLGFVALVLAVGAVALPVAVVSAQQKGGKGKEEEEDDAKKPKDKKPAREEVEEDAPRRPKRKVVVDDEKDERPAKPAAKPGGGSAVDDEVDIAVALKGTKNPALQSFYGDLATPHDVVITKTRGGLSYNAEPLKVYYEGESPRIVGGDLAIRAFDSNWRRGRDIHIPQAQIHRVKPYELHAVDRTAAFLKEDLERFDADNKRYLTRADQLKAAALALRAVESWHDAALVKDVRSGDAWEKVTQQLRAALLNVRIEQLKLLLADGDWRGASAFAVTLAGAYPGRAEREPIAAVLVGYIAQDLQAGGDENYKRARERLKILEIHFPGAEASARIATALTRQAEQLFAAGSKLLEQAKKDNDSEKRNRGLLNLALAEQIAPGLDGLGDMLRHARNAYPILRVGVRTLPTNFLPGYAASDVDRMAQELIYESLVRLRDDPVLGPRYETGLAARLPSLVPLGRDFRIAPGAAWSDGKPVRAADVEATVRLLNDPIRYEGAVPALGKLLNEKVDLGGDVFRVRLDLKQGYFDPLSLMTFKVLPRGVEAEAVNHNKKAPVGSGPYRLGGGAKSLNGRNTIPFITNSHFAARDGRFDQPRIREVQFVDFSAGAEDPADGLLLPKPDFDGVHFAPNIPAAKAHALRGESRVVVVGPLRTRRVYFLAINHRNPAIGGRGNVNLRLALSHSVHREEVLDTCFRGPEGRRAHRALNGLFPAGSWACHPNILPDLHRADRAKSLRASITPPPGGLSLKYPGGDPAVQQAVELIAKQVKQTVDIDLRPEAVSAQKLLDDVEKKHDYDLAYYHYDFPSDAFWIRPLFDSESMETGGTNYLGYADTDLDGPLREAAAQRDFLAVQRAMQTAHMVLHNQMVVVPLWQLDTYHAYRKELTPTALDPLLGFYEVEKWTKE